ncbi:MULTISPECIES: dermonecrotic toxin domain-containing protein [Pseudomonas]|uniref:RING-type E3 ubiquitin transferase n=1 Tax=Pseudomonas azadiae TaxID=2843612 RepID=A0ABS6NZZ6_9PSED|nr:MULTISPECIES: DUF6543 domain-containing protein [Pseudomonas]MBV4453777.1 hypothetical protein [Pseudomonas azadiae]NMF44126.1 hypothetical protein [Pseudomonas sp. SWRI 103]
MPATPTSRPVAVTEPQPIHLDFIKQQLPGWLLDTSPQRWTALAQHQPDITQSHRNAPAPAQRLPLKKALSSHWSAQNAVDKKLAELTDIKAFAEPLLKEALSDYGPIDLQQTSIRLYAPARLPWWAIHQQPGVSTRTTTLLEAALHNFSASETFVDFAFLSQEDAQGQRDTITLTHRSTGKALTADAFKAVCRKLDIGAKYQQHLKTQLGFDDATLASELRFRIIDNLQAGLNSAAHIALVKNDISQDTYTFIQDLLQRDGPLRLGGQSVDLYTLDLLDTRLTGILVIAPPRTDTRIGTIVVHVPDDPAHPLKEYASSREFIKELTGQLRERTPAADSSSISYQQFFSQFVAHEQRGRFFYELNNLLATVRWHARESGDSRPHWRPDPVEAPNLRFRTQLMRDDTQNRISEPLQNNLWHYLYRAKLNKIVNDAREIAISTAYADRMARWAWWDNLEKMLSDLFNAALQVITPLVPFLGELMLAYTAYQMLDDVFEGIVDWAEGLQREGWEHMISVADNVMQLSLFHAGAKIGKIAKVKISPFVDSLLPVQMPTGETRLWNPDLTPYQYRNMHLPSDVVPDENGLYHHQGKRIAQVENSRYEVLQDPITETYHLTNPKRASAYRPPVALNGSGACVFEGEQPRAWNNTRLLRRLGPQTHGLSAGELEQVRLISGVDFGALRHMYVNNEPTPPLLADTLKRFNNERQVGLSVDNIREGRALDPSADWFEQMVTELEGWPRDKALLVYPHADLSGLPRRYGDAAAQGQNALSVSIAEVMSGKLPEKVVAFLDEQQLTDLLGEEVPEAQRAQALREQLATYVEAQGETLAQDLYARQETSSDPHIQLLRNQYPELPLSIAQRLVSHTRRRHLRVMEDHNRLPLDIKNQARELDFETRSSRMFEQILQADAPTAQTENLVLNTLRIHSDAVANLRIQIRERTTTGALRSQVGAEDAEHVRILVRNRKGQYRVFDERDKLIHGATDFYSAVFQAMTADKRFIDGDHLRSWLVKTTTSPADRRLTLTEPPIRARADRETITLLGGGNSSTMRGVEVQARPVTVQGRIKHWLPQMSEQGVKQLAQLAESAEGLAKLEQLENEGKALETALDAYIQSPTQGPAGSRLEAVTRRSRTQFASQLKDAWREGYTQLHDPNAPQDRLVTLDLSENPWPDDVPLLPDDLKLVKRLILNDCNFSTNHAEFLRHFPDLVVLDLSDNSLDRLPAAIAQMRSLTALDLSKNQIALDANSVAQLRNLTSLRGLYLSNNPLGQVPDVSRMPNLMELDLSRTGISEWPTGLFAQDRDALFLLQLQGNPITTIPDVAIGEDESFTIATTRLDYSTLSAEAKTLWEEHRRSVGYDPHRTYEPQGDYSFWVDELDDYNKLKFESIWDDLEEEHGSQGFFEVLKKLEPPEFFEDPEDELRYAHNTPTLTSQVRYMLSSMHDDPALRETLFRMSSFPGLCPDAGSQIFTEMGVLVEARGVELYSKTPAEREEGLVKLARGSARLKLLNHVIRADIADRLKPLDQGGQGLRLTSEVVEGEPGTVDEVGVYLAYQTRLARQLELPWISDNMVYRNTANVPETSITNALTAVQTLSEGDGLVDRMLKEPYWETFLKEHYAQDYAANEENIGQQLALFDDLDSQQKAFAQALDLNEAQKAEKRQALSRIVEQLQIEDRVVPDQVMSDTLYEQVYNDLAARRNEWLREQTRLSLGRLDD